jgi:hypothetical protein
MAVRQPRYSKEEFARRGDEIYESQIRSQVEEGNYGKIVAIDIETGAFEVADDILPATNRLFQRFQMPNPGSSALGIELSIDLVHAASKKLYDSRRSK